MYLADHQVLLLIKLGFWSVHLRAVELEVHSRVPVQYPTQVQMDWEALRPLLDDGLPRTVWVIVWIPYEGNGKKERGLKLLSTTIDHRVHQEICRLRLLQSPQSKICLLPLTIYLIPLTLSMQMTLVLREGV
jgi:hypothetical protein